MKMFEKLLEKKKKEGKEMDPMEKAAKMANLKSLRDEMSGLMKGDLEAGKIKKVEVASNDEEGLKAGLDKAKELVESKEMGDYEEEKEEPFEEMMEIAEACSPEQLDEMIKKLEMLKSKK